MKKLEISDAAYANLQRLASAKHLSPAELIAAMVSPLCPDLSGDSLLFYLTSPEFTRHVDVNDRYLDMLAWCARHFPSDFAEFVAHQAGGRRYLTWNRDEINEARASNQARQIDGTQYWAVMTLPQAARRHFVGRLLEFIGCHDQTVAKAVAAMAPASPTVEKLRLHGT